MLAAQLQLPPNIFRRNRVNIEFLLYFDYGHSLYYRSKSNPSKVTFLFLWTPPKQLAGRRGLTFWGPQKAGPFKSEIVRPCF